MDFLLNKDPTSPNYHDIVWNNGALTKDYTTQPLTQTVGQRLKIRLLTFREEWIFDTTYGVPYWQRILGFKNKKSTIDKLFQEEILKEVGVRQIVNFTSTLDSNRKYSFTTQVKVATGEITEPITISL